MGRSSGPQIRTLFSFPVTSSYYSGTWRRCCTINAWRNTQKPKAVKGKPLCLLAAVFWPAPRRHEIWRRGTWVRRKFPTFFLQHIERSI